VGEGVLPEGGEDRAHHEPRLRHPHRHRLVRLFCTIPCYSQLDAASGYIIQILSALGL
jgi:hypothetical protein